MKIFRFSKLKLIFSFILVSLFFAGIFLFFSQNDNFDNFEKDNTLQSSLDFPVAAGIVPHHLLAKEIIEDFFVYLSSKKDNPALIVLLSPDHFKTQSIAGKSFITLSPETNKFYELEIDNQLIQKLSLENNLFFSNSNISLDHGITNLLPFIKKYFPQIKIIPFLIPSTLSFEQIDQFTNSLFSLAPKNTFVLVSVDFSHYLPSSAAKFHDVKSIRTLINFEKENFKNLEVDCWQCLYIARAFASLSKKESPKIIAFVNSDDLFKSKEEKTTSYFSVVFEKEGKKEKIKETEAKTILFVGDIMLGRGVEYLMRKNSVLYPFEKIGQFLKGIDIVVGNLEGPIVENPPKFNPKTLRFAFSPNVINGLSFANFNLLSLANNHTFDVGESGFEQTKSFLTKANINFVGHPIKCDKDVFFAKDDILFLAFNKTFPFNCSNEEIAEIVKNTKNAHPKKFLVVILHWGEEYQPKSSVFQQKLAHQIIDAGADLIIGAHPHVVQEIEEYRGKLIFYSLGNFIFDQYFSKETQQSLAVGLELYPEEIIYRLFPIESYLSQPFLMEKEKANEFLEKLAKKSSPQLFEQIRNGIIESRR